MTSLVVLTVVDIVLLVAGLAFYLYWAGSLLNRIAANLEDSFESAAAILGHARLIGPGVEHINRTGGVVAGALPLLYGMAEEIVSGVTPATEQQQAGLAAEPARPASGRRRSRQLNAVGFGSDG
jgi:hypothetical protein